MRRRRPAAVHRAAALARAVLAVLAVVTSAACAPGGGGAASSGGPSPAATAGDVAPSTGDTSVSAAPGPRGSASGGSGVTDGSANASAAGRPVPPPPVTRFRCPAATVTVATAPQLKKALAEARPGTVIALQDGVYAGAFTATAAGTAGAPVYLCGGRAAVLTGRSMSKDYALHLKGASHWRVSGFAVRNAQKGVVVDGATDVALQDLLVEHVGDEGVHLRANSTGDVVRGLTIRDTGLLNPKFGEGVYIGTAQNNWGTITGGQPDRSDHDFVVENSISRTTAESVDVKEGTTGGVVAANRFDGTGMTAASAWVNVKGNEWLISGNEGTVTPRDGFQTHVILSGWGERNVFSGNTARLAAGGDGLAVRVQESLGNVVGCTNTADGGHQVSALGCTPSA